MLKTAKTRESRLNAILFWPRFQPKRTHRQPQAIFDRSRGRPRRCAKKKRGSTTFRDAPKSLSHHMMCDTRCGHAPAQKTARTVRWVYPEPRGQLQALEKLEIIAPRRPRRGQRGTNRELRGRSCEKPRALGPARGYS